MKAGRIPEAISAWTRAFAVRPEHSVACAIGRAELLGRGDSGEGSLWLTRCMRLAPPQINGDAQELAAQQEELVLRDLARSRVGALRVEADPGAQITVDGRVIGKAPLADEVFVKPGSHRLTVSLGSRTRSVDVAIAGGESRAVDLAFPAAAARGPGAPWGPSAPAAAETGEGSGWGFKLLTLIIGGGLAAGGVGVGAVLAASSNAAHSQSENAAGEVRAIGSTEMCVGASQPPECLTYRESFVKAEMYGDASKASFIGAGAVAVVTGVIVLWPSGSSSPAVKADARGVRAVWTW